MKCTNELKITYYNIYSVISLKDNILAMGTGLGNIVVFDSLKNNKDAKIFQADWHKDKVFALNKLNDDTVISGCSYNVLLIWNWKK